MPVKLDWLNIDVREGENFQKFLGYEKRYHRFPMPY
jgi:hypothetical protein